MDTVKAGTCRRRELDLTQDRAKSRNYENLHAEQGAA